MPGPSRPAPPSQGASAQPVFDTELAKAVLAKLAGDKGLPKYFDPTTGDFLLDKLPKTGKKISYNETEVTIIRILYADDTIFDDVLTQYNPTGATPLPCTIASQLVNALSDATAYPVDKFLSLFPWIRLVGSMLLLRVTTVLLK